MAGMILDGVAASNAVDSSGELLHVEGLDITSLNDSTASLNWEHLSDDGKEDAPVGDAAGPLSKVGRILWAKHILSAADCSDARQRQYWDLVELPFVYFQAELFDSEGHAQAQALAAIVRHYHDRGLPILVRFSVEGSTLERKNNELIRSVARAVAVTVKPCNRTAHSGVLSDPNHPNPQPKMSHLPGFRPEASAVHAFKAEDPLRQHLGGSELECQPWVNAEPLDKGEGRHALDRCMDCQKPPEIEFRWAEGMAHAWFCAEHGRAWQAKNPGEAGPIRRLTAGRVGEDYGDAPGEALDKALEAGIPAGAPDSLTGGAALQREALSPMVADVTRFGSQVKAALRDWDRETPWRDFLKSRLPEASEAFLDHFAALVDDYRLKKAREPGDAEDLGGDTSFDPKALEAPAKAPLTIRGQPIPANPNLPDIAFDSRRGILHTPRGSLPVYIPGRDKQPGAAKAFHEILNDPDIEDFHGYALDQWHQLHQHLRAGTLPPAAVMHAALFSTLSTNTPVPIQELMYGHLLDAMKSTGTDLTSAEGLDRLKQDWMARDRADAPLPEARREHFERYGDTLRVGGHPQGDLFAGRSRVGEGRQPGELQAWQLANDKWDRMAKYPGLHADLLDMVQRHRQDARAATAELMERKRQHKNWENRQKIADKKGQPGPGPNPHGVGAPGLKVKTGRYMFGMLGGGNVMVPDTHFSRYLFGLDQDKDTDSIEYVKNLLWNTKNTGIMEALDRYYLRHHDAVKHLLAHPKHGQKFQDPQDAIFPAFWKNWVAIGPHERSRGMASKTFNDITDHRPFWEAVQPLLNKAEEAQDQGDLPLRTARTHLAWVQQYGEVPALLLYYRFLVPQLLAAQEQGNEDPVVKQEVLQVSLRKAAAGLREQKARDKAQEQEVVSFGRQLVKPGHAEVYRGDEPQHYAILHEEPHRYVAVPQRVLGKWHARDLVGLNKDLEGKEFRVRRPAELVPGAEVIDAQRHGLLDLNHHQEQHDLVHGLDLGSAGRMADWGHTHAHNRWLKNGRGDTVFVKADPTSDSITFQGPRGARREVQYHNLARDFFGLGQHLPWVAAVRHPITGREYAVLQHADGEHYDALPGQDAQLKALGDSGDLDRLALMNLVLGNGDRSATNYVLSPEGGLRLIDHAGALGEGWSGTQLTPHYLRAYLNLLLQGQGPLVQDPRETGTEDLQYTTSPHPAALQWFRALKAGEFEQQLMRNGATAAQRKHALQRFRALRDAIRVHPQLTRWQALQSPYVPVTGLEPKGQVR